MKGFIKMTDEEIERLFNKITEESADRIIQLYLEYMDRKFIEESKKVVFQKHYHI